MANNYLSGAYGYAIPGAYQIDGAGYLQCTECGAKPGKPCVGPEHTEAEPQVKKIPHTPRLALGYATNNPKGRKRAEERAARMSAHRWEPPQARRER